MPYRGRQRTNAGAALLALLALGALLLPAACSRNKQAPRRAAPVIVEAVERKNVPLQLKAIGSAEAYTTVVVKSQVNGEIAEVHFTEGRDVRRGDRLFTIDPRPFEAALRQAEAALARDAAQARNAEQEARRYEALAEKGYVSRQEYDRIRTNADALTAVVRADEAAVENARLQLEYTKISSPIDGRTGTIMVNRGNVVKANDIALVTINQIAPIYVTFAIPEADLPALQKHRAGGGLRVAARTQAGGKPSEGSLSFIDNAVNRATGTITLKALFPNRDRALWPGQFADILLTLTVEKNRTVVAARAVQTGQQGQYVYVVKEDLTAEMRPVTVARPYEHWAVIEGGLKPGERVVVDGQIRLTPGALVEIKNAAPNEAKPGK